MVGEIAYAPDFVKSLDKLVVKLYEKEYFGFIDSSFVYTNKIYEYIESKIELSNHLKSLILSNVIPMFSAAKVSNKKKQIIEQKINPLRNLMRTLRLI